MRRATTALMAAVLTAACSASPTSLSPSIVSTPSTAPVTWQGPATALVCRIADDVNGVKAVYYLDVHSAGFDFSPCNSGVAKVSIHMGDPRHLLGEGLAELQHRCMYSGATDDSVNGFVNVISTPESANVAAANRLCAAHHGVTS